MDTEEHDFVQTAPEERDEHIFAKCVRLDRWLSREGCNGQDEQYFGSCPFCLDNDGYLNIQRAHYFYCRIHRVVWLAGENLFSSWREQSKFEFDENRAYLKDFRIICPLFHQRDR
jgi:hypothetical protein